MSDSLWPYGLSPASLFTPWGFPGKNTGVGCIFFCRWSSRPGDQACVSYIPCNGKQVLYHYCHLESPRRGNSVIGYLECGIAALVLTAETKLWSSFVLFHVIMVSVGYDGYSISSKEILSTVVSIMVIWVKFTHSSIL